jgi:hypothetical protein
MPVIGYLFWLALVSAWLDACDQCANAEGVGRGAKVGASASPPPPSADIVDLAQWRLSHPRPPANGNDPTRGRAA